MKINVKSKNFELTDPIKIYVEKKVSDLENVLSAVLESGAELLVNFEVGKSTKHHKMGEVFHADCLISVGGMKFYASSDKEDIYEAIDEIKETLFNEIRKNKDRKHTLFKRGATSIKKMMKGLSRRNPWTSKY